MAIGPTVHRRGGQMVTGPMQVKNYITATTHVSTCNLESHGTMTRTDNTFKSFLSTVVTCHLNAESEQGAQLLANAKP